MKTAILTTAIILTAGYIGQTKQADYHRDMQEENRVIQAYDRGFEDGQYHLIANATAELCGGYSMNCGYAPALTAPPKKPEV